MENAVITAAKQSQGSHDPGYQPPTLLNSPHNLQMLPYSLITSMHCSTEASSQRSPTGEPSCPGTIKALQLHKGIDGL